MKYLHILTLFQHISATLTGWCPVWKIVNYLVYKWLCLATLQMFCQFNTCIAIKCWNVLDWCWEILKYNAIIPKTHVILITTLFTLDLMTSNEEQYKSIESALA